MTATIGIRELRDNLTTTIRRVRQGETIEITHHGDRVAVLAPIGKDRIDRLLDAPDIVAPRSDRLPTRRHAVTGPMTASKALEEDRSER